MTQKTVDEVQRIWNETFAGSGAVLIARFSKDRLRRLRLRWQEWSEVGDPADVFARLCRFIRADKWHMNPAARNPEHRGWRVNIDYLIRNDTKWLGLWERAVAQQERKRYGPQQPKEDGALKRLFEEYAGAAGPDEASRISQAIAKRRRELAQGPYSGVPNRDQIDAEIAQDLRKRLDKRGSVK